MKSVSWYSQFAKSVSNFCGRPAVFMIATASIVVWGASGPLFGFSDTWQLVVNTSTTIITFLMVFVIQSSQNRDTAAIQMPIAAGGEQRPTPVSKQLDVRQSAGNKKINILIVDDNKDAAEMLSYLLAADGHTVEVVNCPTAALRNDFHFVPDVAILDIGLPVMTGYELLEELRKKREWQQCVFIALTGYGQTHDHELSQSAGFTQHFVKPIDPKALFQFLDELSPSGLI